MASSGWQLECPIGFFIGGNDRSYFLARQVMGTGPESTFALVPVAPVAQVPAGKV